MNSGRTSWRSKRDNILGDYLIEARTTEAESYRIDRHEFLAIQKHAFQTPPGKLPAMQPTIRGLELWVMRLIDFEAMRGRITELEAELAAYRNDAGE